MDKNGRKPDFVDDAFFRRVEEISRVVGIPAGDVLREALEEFAASRVRPSPNVKETPIGKRLRAIRARIVRSGARLLNASDIDRELAEGRRQRGN